MGGLNKKYSLSIKILVLPFIHILNSEFWILNSKRKRFQQCSSNVANFYR